MTTEKPIRADRLNGRLGGVKPHEEIRTSLSMDIVLSRFVPDITLVNSNWIT
jgi:hypothetical protein